MFKINLLIFLSFVALSVALDCNPRVVEWFRHPNSCTKYIICFHGNALEFSCAPHLHFNEVELMCMLPAEAKCDINYMCPEVDDEANPVFLPDRNDCTKYFVCFKGTPLPRSCATNLWFDIENNWCTFEDEVTCDDRTPNNPNNPNATPTSEPDTTTSEPETTTVISIPTEAPNLSVCLRQNDLFNSESGEYMKSLCIVNTMSNYDASEEGCVENNMHLFVINDGEVQSRFFNAMTAILIGQWANGFVWINGRRDDASREWLTFNPAKAPLYDGIDWVQTETIDGRTSGDCLRYSQQHGDYMAMGAACTTTSWYTCEFHTPPQLNTEICWSRNEIIDEDGAYMKSSCIINTSVTQVEAQQTCVRNGMRLFVINNSTVQTSFFKSTTQALIQQTGGFVWINGQRDTAGDWFVYNPARVPLYNGIDWVQTETVDGRTSGDCLRYTQQFGEFRSMGVSCSATSWFICEF